MSRRRSTAPTKMAVPEDVDMGPPPAPASTAIQQPNHDVNEKYRQLKRRFFELEEKHKETSTELQRSGERNVKMREERNILLDRIIELENEYSFKSNSRSSLSPPLSSALAQPGSSALPRTLLGARARASFVANLREAVDDPDDDADPILSSRHVGPEARRRYEDESRERFDEESREPRRSGRKTRSSLSQAGANNKGKGSNISEGGSPTHNAPGSRSSPPITSPSRGQSGYPPLPSTQSHPHLYTHPPPPPPPNFQDQRYSHPRQHSATPDQDDYHQSQSPGCGIEIGDSSISGMFDRTPPQSNSHPVRGAGTSAQDHNSNDCDHRSNGNPEPNMHDGNDAGNPGSDSRKPDSAEPSSTPRRGSLRTRRSTRVENAAARQVDDDQSELPRRTRAASKRGNPSASPRAVIKTRATRRGNAADAEAKVAGKPTLQHDSTHLSAVAPSEAEPQDVQMDDASRVDEATANHEGPAPTTTAPTTSHPSYLDPALASQSAQGTAPPSNPAPANPTEPSATQSSPMENIVRVAEAAVAAQNASNATLNQTSLRPASSAPTQPTVQTTNLPQNGGTSNTPTSTTSPSSSTFNPYMMLGAIKPTVNVMSPGMPTPGIPVHPLALGMNPYAMYYPPGMPMSPSTPTYPYANPYYYMGPVPGPNGMYPPTNFVPPNAQRASPADGQRPAKPKRLKAHTVTSKNFSIPMVPRDKSGKPMLPLNVGIMTVIKLGDVCMREHFHTERYIFPVGYEVSRRYLSTMDPNIEVVYHCTILDGGDGPKFQIIPSDVPDRPVIAGTATGAWSSIVKQANAIRNRQHSNSVSGPDFFGLGQNTIKHLIQELPNADRLRDYVWQRFIEGGPLGGRHAAVIPALPEEFDASHSVGTLHYDKQKDTSPLVPASSPKGIYHYPQHIQQQAMQQQQQAQQQQASGSQGSQANASDQGGGYYPDHPLGRTTRSNATSGDGDTTSGSVRSNRSSNRSKPQQSNGAMDSNAPNVIPATIATLLNSYPSGGPGPHG